MSQTAKTAIDTASAFLEGVDVSKKLDGVLEDIKNKTGFIVDGEVSRSSYYGSDQIGAVLYRGSLGDKRVILKVQGVKPEMSEIVMIKAFESQNKSKIVRPPKIYEALPWNDDLGYEAFMMEEVKGSKVINSKELQTTESLEKFFNIYKEYRRNCINEPWIGGAGNLGLSEAERQRVKQMVAKLKPDSVLRKQSDFELADKATDVLNKVWSGKKSRFMHGHFSAEDLIEQGDEVVLFSNLFWKWKHEFYDAVFAYHFCMISLTHREEMTEDIFDEQRKLWLDRIYDLSESEGNDRMIATALLERMLACLLIDGVVFSKDESSVSRHLIETTRDEIKRLMSELS